MKEMKGGQFFDHSKDRGNIEEQFNRGGIRDKKDFGSDGNFTFIEWIEPSFD